jgi:hypothetical protein
MSNSIRSGPRLKNESQLNLHLSHRKMKCKQGFKYVQNQIPFVYQGTILSELHNSSPTIKNDPRFAPIPKAGISILPVCLKIHRRQVVQILGAWSLWRIFRIRPAPNIPPIMIINSIYEHQNVLSL